MLLLYYNPLYYLSCPGMTCTSYKNLKNQNGDTVHNVLLAVTLVVIKKLFHGTVENLIHRVLRWSIPYNHNEEKNHIHKPRGKNSSVSSTSFSSAKSIVTDPVKLLKEELLTLGYNSITSITTTQITGRI
jgi:hypothetical protein